MKGQIEGEWVEVAFINSHVQQVCMQVTIPTSQGYPLKGQALGAEGNIYVNYYLHPINYIYSSRGGGGGGGGGALGYLGGRIRSLSK